MILKHICQLFSNHVFLLLYSTFFHLIFFPLSRYLDKAKCQNATASFFKIFLLDAI